jgi:hypothetical protein
MEFGTDSGDSSPESPVRPVWVAGEVQDHASRTLDVGAARAAFATLQCGAVDVQGQGQTASASSSLEAPSPKGMGGQSSSTALRALPLAEAPPDEHGGERRPRTPPNFQEPLSAHSASIEAARNPTGDARKPQLPGKSTAPPQEGRLPRRRPPPRQRAQDKAQLSLFPGLGGPGG